MSRAMTTPAIVAATGPKLRFTIAKRTATVAMPQSASGRRMLHDDRPKRRTDRPMEPSSPSGGLSTVMKLAGVDRAEEPGAPALRRRERGGRVVRVRESADGEVREVEHRGEERDADVRRRAHAASVPRQAGREPRGEGDGAGRLDRCRSHRRCPVAPIGGDRAVLFFRAFFRRGSRASRVAAACAVRGRIQARRRRKRVTWPRRSLRRGRGARRRARRRGRRCRGSRATRR